MKFSVIISFDYMRVMELEYRRAKCVEDGGVRVRIVMEPKSISLVVPLEWEINKIKCMLCNMIPKLEFGMVSLRHDGVEIPGELTLGEVLAGDG